MSGDGAPASEWAWIALGCNLGHRGRALGCLRAALEASGLALEGASSEILTLPVGVTTQGDFHNQVLVARAPEPWPARRWLEVCLGAENACGRRPTYRWGPRRADADLILLGRRGELASPGEPEVPHPGLQQRPFWHRLIAEIDPEVAAGIRPRPADPPRPSVP